MSPSATPDQIRRVARTHARTLQLMGVDFVPMRQGLRVQVAATVVEPKPTTKPTTRPTTRPEAAARPGDTPVSTAPTVFDAADPAPQRSVVAAAASGAPAAGSGEGRPRLAPVLAAELLDELLARYEREAPHAKFVTDHHSIVFGEGDPAARLMFVGEAPGAEEDRTGRPFVGRAGQLLDKMINAMGLRREQVYIANVLKTRPPNNATPTSDECAACAPYLYEQIMIIRPEVIVTLGLPASRTLLNSMESMGALRGRWWTFRPPARLLGAAPGAQGLSSGWNVPVMPTYHPAFLLRSYTTENRQKVWDDLCLARDRLGLARPGVAASASPPGAEG